MMMNDKTKQKIKWTGTKFKAPQPTIVSYNSFLHFSIYSYTSLFPIIP